MAGQVGSIRSLRRVARLRPEVFFLGMPDERRSSAAQRHARGPAGS